MQDAQLISQAGLVDSLASDGLVSVSTGAGQPQKNMELAKFADSLGSSVPLQQTSEQVSITGLYARTSDGKMVELTKESVASVMAGLIGSFKNFGNLTDADTAVGTGMYKIYGSVNNSPVSYGVLSVFNAGDYILQVASDVGKGTPTFYVRSRNSDSWTSWMALNNFGYNSLAELSSGVAQQMTTGKLFPFMLKGIASGDLNNLEDGYYAVHEGNSSITNNPSGEGYGNILVYSAKGYGSGGNPCTQIFTSENSCYIRSAWNGTWGAWKKIQFA